MGLKMGDVQAEFSQRGSPVMRKALAAGQHSGGLGQSVMGPAGEGVRPGGDSGSHASRIAICSCTRKPSTTTTTTSAPLT